MSVGTLLQYWRKTRNLSQLALATEAEVSARHLSFIETGRANPSFFSTVTTLGTPQDVTVQELRIECFFPADEHTAQAARQLMARA